MSPNGFDISLGCNIIFCVFYKSKRQHSNMFNFDLQDILEHGQIYAMHQTKGAPGFQKSPG